MSRLDQGTWTSKALFRRASAQALRINGRLVAVAALILALVCIPHDARCNFCVLSTELTIVPVDPAIQSQVADYDVVINYMYIYAPAPQLQGMTMTAGPKGWRANPPAFSRFSEAIALTDATR